MGRDAGLACVILYFIPHPLQKRPKTKQQQQQIQKTGNIFLFNAGEKHNVSQKSKEKVFLLL